MQTYTRRKIILAILLAILTALFLLWQSARSTFPQSTTYIAAFEARGANFFTMES